MNLSQNLKNSVEESLKPVLGSHLTIRDFKPVGGGCINNGGELKTNEGSFFLKYNDNRFEGMFETEAKGLRLLKEADAIHIPEVFATGKTPDNQIFIVIEWITGGRRGPQFWEQFGYYLADLHRVSNDKFGLDFDNYIGSLPQYNNLTSDWTEFFINERLERQVQIGESRGRIPTRTVKNIRNIYSKLEKFFPKEKPALLHGDLWGGNFMVNSAGEPSLIDPAVYYGHREMELAFTQMFGGFDQKFYQAYDESFPLEAGFEERKDIYNLYPLLVHVNLFGGIYLSDVQQIIKRFQ